MRQQDRHRIRDNLQHPLAFAAHNPHDQIHKQPRFERTDFKIARDLFLVPFRNVRPNILTRRSGFKQIRKDVDFFASQRIGNVQAEVELLEGSEQPMRAGDRYDGRPWSGCLLQLAVEFLIHQALKNVRCVVLAELKRIEYSTDCLNKPGRVDHDQTR